MSRKSPFGKLSMRIAGEKSSSLDQARGRIVLIVALFMGVYILIAARLLDATIIQGYFSNRGEKEAHETVKDTVQKRRGDIVDRNGVMLAASLKTASLYADQKRITDPVAAAKALSNIFPEMRYGDLLKKVQGEKRFVWIRRNLTPSEQRRILEIGEPGLAFEYDYRRVYPQGKMTSHIVGYTDTDGKGIAGIEHSFNKLLTSSSDPLKLTMDIRLQHIMKRELQKAITEFTAIGGAGIIMDVNTGEVLASVSLPDFDPHETKVDISDSKRFNRATLGVYELGSTFKVFTAAAVLEKDHITMSKTFDATRPLKRGRFTISDYHPEKRALTLPETFMVSSNIGTALMAEEVGTAGMKNLYRDLGFMEKADFEIDELGKPIIPSPWREINTLTASYGHGIAVSPLQLISGVSSIANGGYLIKPTIIKKDDKDMKKSEVRIISKETSLKMRQLLRLVVTDGTARKADVKGYMVGGKTGTSDKNFNGRYAKDRRMSSFIGVFPVNDPKYAVLIIVDEPHGNKSSYGYATAGWVAAPAAARVISSIGPILNMKKDMEAPDLAEPLRPFLHDKVAEH